MQDSDQAGVKSSKWNAEWRTFDVMDKEGQPLAMRFWGAVLIWTIGLLTVNILPLVFQALQGRDGIGEGELGTLGATFVLGTVTVTGTSPLWIQHANWRFITICGLVASAGGFVLSVWVSGFHQLLICFAAIGAGAGLIQTPSYAVLGSARDTVRAFGVALFVSMVLPAILSFSVSGVSATSGGDQFLWIVAAIFAAAIPLAGALPRGLTRSAGLEQSAAPVDAPALRLRDYGAATAAPIAASFAGGIFSGVIMAVYSFVGSLASANGLPADVTGALVGFGLLGALAGSLVPTVLENWMRPTTGLALVVTMLVTVAYPAMLSSSPHVFSAGFVMACLVGTAGFAYFLAMVRSVDPTHRIYIGYAAFQSTGIAAATYAAGILLNDFSPVVMLTAASACLVASWFIWLLAVRLSLLFPV